MENSPDEILMELTLLKLAIRKIPSKDELIKELTQNILLSLQENGLLKSHETHRDDLIQGDKAAAEFLNVCKSTIFNWRKSRQIPFKRINGRIFFSRTELVSAMKKFGR